MRHGFNSVILWMGWGHSDASKSMKIALNSLKEVGISRGTIIKLNDSGNNI